jgi:uncharacterized protein YndB with AHSA1/START domain
MGDHERSTTVDATPDRLFDYLSDVGNLPHYFAAMESAEPAGGDTVHTVAEVDGTRREGDAWLTAEDGSRTMRWGAPGPSDYAGELTVAAEGSGSRVTVRLHTQHGDAGSVESGLEETLATIKRNVEQGADPAAP